MGIKQLIFRNGPLSENKIKKIAKLASNPFAQPDIRMREMQKLVDEGTSEAFSGLLKRFSSNAHGAIADEDEKKWLEDTLVNLGTVVLEPLRLYIRREKQLTYALRAYVRLTSPAEAAQFFLETLGKYGPEDYRSADAKLQIVWQLSEHLAETDVISNLVEFLLDHSDDVRWAIMDLLESAAAKKTLGDELLVMIAKNLWELLVDKNTGPRIQHRAVDIFIKYNWQVPEDGRTLVTTLDEDFFIDKKNYVRKRIKKN